MNKKFGIKDVVAIGIGTALFIVLTNVQVPLGFIPNTSLQSRVAVLTFFSAVFGPIVGGVIGLVGHALGDALFLWKHLVELGIPRGCVRYRGGHLCGEI